MEATESDQAKKTDFSDLGYFMYLKGQTLERMGTDKLEILAI